MIVKRTTRGCCDIRYIYETQHSFVCTLIANYDNFVHFVLISLDLLLKYSSWICKIIWIVMRHLLNILLWVSWMGQMRLYHDDVIKWKHFPRNWPFVRGIHRSPVNSPHKGLWRGALMFSLICVWINDWVNNHEAGDLRRYLAHYDVIVM